MSDVSSVLLHWYDLNARVLPWRGIHDPYKTWISEAMLQQTRVDTVIPYYSRFLDRFPDVRSLSEAEESEVLKLWEGLGYYSRARNLLQGAVQIMDLFDGKLPADPAKLRTIKGIGPYMSAAIASIAFDLPVPAIDGNVIRVICRLYNIQKDVSIPAVRKEIESVAFSLVPPVRAGDYNQAMMDLGATVCIPGTPDCKKCPLSAFCKAYEFGNAPVLPVIPKSKPQKRIPWTVIVIHSGKQAVVRRRTEKLLNGLWCFPMLEGHIATEDLREAVYKAMNTPILNLRYFGESQHVFTHQIWDMVIYTGDLPSGSSAPDGYILAGPEEINEKAFPAAMNAALHAFKTILNEQ